MKPFLILILLFSSNIQVFGQNNPDSLGFTNKKEAKNVIVNGKKEGKWCVGASFCVMATGGCNYTLGIYRADVPCGTFREYNSYGRLVRITRFVNGKKNGVEEVYDDGRLAVKRIYINDTLKLVRRYDEK
ncbi:MAG TPA: hypothetical protein VK806_06485 [Bacteroidia bacterium]|nr:hypothetical protein [Bacteroidia bacterium]